MGAVEGGLILSACVVEGRGEGGWERTTYHTGEASASADRRMKQNAARGNARNPPSRQRFLHPLLAPLLLAPPHGISSAGGSTRQCFDAGGQGGAAMRRRGGINEGRGGGAAERRKQKEMVLSKNMETWGAVNWGAGEGVGVGGAINRTRWARGVVPARTRWTCGGGSGSDQARQLAWVHSMCRMHPGVI